MIPGPCASHRNRQGIILLLVLAVLSLVSILGLTFVSMARLERAISLNYVDRTRAVLAAESGVEYAIARIREFRGGALTPAEMAALEYESGNLSLPLSEANRPSFVLPGKTYSGVVGSTYAPDADRFKLRVVDLGTRINLNDANLEWNLPVTDRKSTRLNSSH